MMEIRLIGDVAIHRDGEKADLPKSRKTMALLAFLVMTGRHQHRNRLCSLFWDLTDDPRGSLRWSLSKLRLHVDEPGARRIVSDSGTVGIELLGAEVDALTIRDTKGQDLAAMPLAQLQSLTELSDGLFLENLEVPNCEEFQAWKVAEQNELARLEAEILRTFIQRTEDPSAGKRCQLCLNRLAGQVPQMELTTDAGRADLRAGAPTVAHERDQNAPLPDKPSIAVLPFENMSAAADQDYFVDGITEDIITSLSRFRSFFVIARNSTFSYKGQAVDIATVGRELGVQYVLEGSVRRAGSRIRITAQLIDATNGHHVWAERYDCDETDIFDAQDDITEKITSALGPEVLKAEMTRARRMRLRNPNAREYFLRGLWHFSHFTEPDNAIALDFAKRGIAVSADDAELHTLISLTAQIDFIYGWCRPRAESIRLCVDMAHRAVELDGQSARTHRCKGLAELYTKRHDSAIASLERAIELNPNDADAFQLLGATLGYAGDYEAAFSNIRKAMRLSPRDPFTAVGHLYMAHAATVSGKDEIALDWAVKIRREKPSFPGAYRVAAASLVHLGRLEEARAELQVYLTFAPNTTIGDVRLVLPIKESAAMDRYLGALRDAGLPD